MDNNHNSTYKILVVEDDTALRDLYVQILRDEGYQVDEAPDGEIAFVKMQKGGYDLVLLDIILPKIDGLTILERLNSAGASIEPNKNVIVISNLGQDAAISKAIGLGAKGYLIKSDYTPGEIVEHIRKVLTLG